MSLSDSYRVAIATQQGVSHMITDIPCQDMVSITKMNHSTFLGLSDGAGSKKYSGAGAKYILEELSTELSTNLDYYLQSDDIQHVLTEFIEITLYLYAAENAIDFEELDSTLLVVLLYGNSYLLLHIGDGLIVSIDTKNELQLLSLPENGEYANETYFTTTVNYKDRLRISQGNSEDIARGVLICSDGIEDLLYDYQTLEVSSVVKTMMNWLDDYSEQEVSEILAHNLEKNFSQKSDDDLSIILCKGGL